MKIFSVLVPFAALLASGLAVAGSQSWGGKHIQIDVIGTQARISFDCAEGSASGWKLNAKGIIDVIGTTTAYAGGPVNPNNPRQHPVATRYTAQIVGNTMTLTLSSKGGISRYTLVKGAQGELYHCM